MGQWWNGNEKGKQKYSERKLFQCHFVYHRSDRDRHSIEQRYQQLEDGD